MKKIIPVICIFLILALSVTVSADISVYVNNLRLNFDQEPVIVNDRTLVPLRKIFEALGADVEWNDETKTVTAQKGMTLISLSVGSDTAYVNGEEVMLNAAAEIRNGRTMVPVRFISEAFGCDTRWQEKTQNIYITSENHRMTRDLSVIFCDVGQGDCIIIMLPNGKNMLIDSGTSDNADKITERLMQNGISRLDYVIATHPHSDHIGAMSKILENIEFGEIYMPRVSTGTKVFENFLEAVKSKGKKINSVFSENVLFDENGLRGEFTAPTRIDYSDLNDCSAVFKLTYLNKAFLFTGDAGYIPESEMKGDISADVLKTAHHGANTASSDAFISRVNPRYAIISVGAGNSYGHPSETVLKAFENHGITVYRTDIYGDINAVCDGDKLEFSFGNIS